MKYNKINQRSLTLLSSAHNADSLVQVNEVLRRKGMKEINYLDWNLWVNFYLPLALKDVTYEQELLYNDRSLSWFANDLKRRHHKTIIS